MNDQDQLIRREAMRLDALEGIGDPDMDGRVAWRASSEDSIWTAAVMPAAGYDQLSMAYDAGDTLIHRLTWHPQHGAWMLRRTYTAHHQPGGDRTRETLDAIATWEQGAANRAARHQRDRALRRNTSGQNNDFHVHRSFPCAGGAAIRILTHNNTIIILSILSQFPPEYNSKITSPPSDRAHLWPTLPMFD